MHVSEAISDIATPLLDNVTAALEVICWSVKVAALEHYHMDSTHHILMHCACLGEAV